MIAGVPRESFSGERRVALVPAHLAQLRKKGFEILIEAGAGEPAGYSDQAYRDAGAEIVATRTELFQRADLILQVRAGGANPEAGVTDLALMRQGQIVIGMQDPLSEPRAVEELAGRGVTAFALELMPRTTRAQSMDVLSSMATVAGYKAVLMAADALPRMFPMLMTAAGTLAAARVLVIGAGVAGLQAIATARRLGAVVRAYDVRPAVKEQIESLGAQFVEMPLETGDSETKGGYAKVMDEDFYRRQRELMSKELAACDVVITTAAIPGKKAPILITGQMVELMTPGSVIVDLAAERGGNCELTRPGETVEHKEIKILGPLNLASAIPYHASQMYSRNMANFLLHIIAEGKLKVDPADPIPTETQVASAGQVTNKLVLEALGRPAAQ